MNNTEIQDELKEISPLLAGLHKINIFTAPESYFITLCENIFNILKVEKKSDVPENYFNTLADTILRKIKAEKITPNDELKNLSPLLYGIKNKNVFDIPSQYYFENFSKKIIKIIKKPQQAKVILLRKHNRTILKYIAAAVFIGIIIWGVSLFQNKNKTDSIIAQGTKIAREKTFDKELAKITDADIVVYLKNSNEEIDLSLLTTTIDENDLPDQEDYLLDDQTLDKYFNKNNSNNLTN